MIWNYFVYIAYSVAILWLLSIALLYLIKSNKKHFLITISLASIGTFILLTFITVLWIDLKRPPMRTLGETRLWYSLFLSIVGIFFFIRWKYKWFLLYSLFMSIVFLVINLVTPENYSKVLMPALQSPWFVPHVIVYMFAYALLGASSIVAVRCLWDLYIRKSEIQNLNLTNNLVYAGFAFLTMGMLFGALWAKQAWGHYWTWDPKETWAFLTWAIYIVYIHLSYFNSKKTKLLMWILSVAFVFLLICWLGLKYIPTAQNSIHVYSE